MVTPCQNLPCQNVWCYQISISNFFLGLIDRHSSVIFTQPPTNPQSENDRTANVTGETKLSESIQNYSGPKSMYTIIVVFLY